MITVTGYIDGVFYTAVIDPDNVPQDDHPGYLGVVTGSPHLLDLLRLHEGESVAVTPTGPFATLDFNDPASVVTALRGLTRVVNVLGGDAVTGPPPDDEPTGTVY